MGMKRKKTTITHKRKVSLSQKETSPKKPLPFWKVIVTIGTIGGVITFGDWICNKINEPLREKEKQYERDYGTITPKKVNDNSLTWRIGTGSIYFPDGVFDLQNVIPNLPDIKTLKKAEESPFKGVEFKAWLKEGKLKVNTRLLDPEGHVIASLIENEWKVNRPTYAYDRNFNDTSLEVKDHFDNVVFQIDISRNNIFLRGIFNRPDSLVASVFTYAPTSIRDTSALGAVVLFNKKNYKELYLNPNSPIRIKPIFKYPSSLHKGERID